MRPSRLLCRGMSMDQDTENKDSRLIPILREGVAVIQMIFFKELKKVISKKHHELDASAQTCLQEP